MLKATAPILRKSTLLIGYSEGEPHKGGFIPYGSAFCVYAKRRNNKVISEIILPDTHPLKTVIQGRDMVQNAEGYFITNAHVLKPKSPSGKIIPPPNSILDFGRNEGFVGDLEWEGFTISDITIIEIDEISDIGLFKANFALSPVKLKFNADEPIGTTIGFNGYPFPNLRMSAITTSFGIISAYLLNRSKRPYIKTIQIDAMNHEGNSGGPLFLGDTGEVIGIMSRRFDPRNASGKIENIKGRPIHERTNISFAVSIDHARPLLERAGIF